MQIGFVWKNFRRIVTEAAGARVWSLFMRVINNWSIIFFWELLYAQPANERCYKTNKTQHKYTSARQNPRFSFISYLISS